MRRTLRRRPPGKVLAGGDPNFGDPAPRFERLSRSADHEYTKKMVVAGGPGLSGGDKVHVQLLYSELGWKMVDPNVFADVVSANTAPLPPVISNRVDFIADGEEKCRERQACHAPDCGSWRYGIRPNLD